MIQVNTVNFGTSSPIDDIFYKHAEEHIKLHHEIMRKIWYNLKEETGNH